ncbi:MAG: Coenzyme F420 hydrogenase/dehydrogenase, beta subunit C-terminal domain [Prevotella sp.]|nr:Coenzyme F420 hydrogenase/dehydrogenase, beta subunit C-terminal domain [Prevotella sp.]
MINVIHAEGCCGCSACVQKCPKQCISLVEDREGFLYPKVDFNLCIDCGLCEKVCPFLNVTTPLTPKTVIAVKNPNEKERMSSSSGGVFISLAHKIINEGGVVFGVSFDDNWGACMTYAETMADIKPMMGSKYFQASMGTTFKNAEKFLKKGRKVLFSGCPCQIAGLRNYLHNDYDNLLTVDLLCHGVASPGVWKRYWDELYKKMAFEKKSDGHPIHLISNISFRDKSQHGWPNFSFTVRTLTNNAHEESILLSEMHSRNLFYRGFCANLYLRPSCHSCKCKGGRSHSDITIGDYWGIDHIIRGFNDNKGVSVVMINTKKGGDIFKTLDMDIRLSSLKDMLQGNREFLKSPTMHPKREYFYMKYNSGTPIHIVIRKCLYRHFFIRLFTYGKRCIKKGIRYLTHFKGLSYGD